MLASKSTCKDRWRQMLNEAVRIPDKHLLTLEPSISENQTNEMKSEQVQPVIPQGLHSSYTLAQQYSGIYRPDTVSPDGLIAGKVNITDDQFTLLQNFGVFPLTTPFSLSPRHPLSPPAQLAHPAAPSTVPSSLAKKPTQWCDNPLQPARQPGRTASAPAG
ncbi:hypothetical protein DRX19_23085 [Salmonella enterica subsp. enterica]|nr:hypothetical protein [Salmonella enterica subsp. enterica serovar Pensacola]